MNKFLNLTMNPWFVTGFTDAEGCFSLSVVRNKELKVGWAVRARFQIGLHNKDKTLLEQIQSYFGVGSINFKHGPQTIEYWIVSAKDLATVVSHFEKFPLLTQKHADYELWKQALRLIEQKEHLTEAGLAKIVAIKASMNKDLSDELKLAFPDTHPLPRPLVEDPDIKDPNWLAGFTSGEGCFMINTNNSPSHRLGVQVQLVFQLTQHTRDITLMENLINYLDCGLVFNQTETAVVFKVKKLSDLIEKIIPFFVKYPILGVKSKDFEDWCKVAELMQSKEHLTAFGLDQIRKIKAGINKGR